MRSEAGVFWFLIWLVTLGLVAFGAATYQVFIDTGDPATGYGPAGAELLVDVEGELRETETLGYMSPAGWGKATLEFYVDDELTGSCDVPVVIYVLQDADLDGDIDLYDFAEFQRLFTGPR